MRDVEEQRLVHEALMRLLDRAQLNLRVEAVARDPEEGVELRIAVIAPVRPARRNQLRIEVANQRGERVLREVGAVGGGLTITATVPGNEVQPPDVIVTLYVPLIATVADEIVGFCNEDVNAAGPVQLYVPVAVGVVKLIAEPAHIGELLPAVGVAGETFTTTVTVPAKEVQPVAVLVTVTLYVPAIAVVDNGIEGFCVVVASLRRRVVYFIRY